MRQAPRVELKVEGLEELRSLLETAEQQAVDLQETVSRINSVCLGIQAKINQPTAEPDG